MKSLTAIRRAVWLPVLCLSTILFSWGTGNRWLLYGSAAANVVLLVSYFRDEIVSDLRGDKACAVCGHQTRFRSFRVYVNCPRCGAEA